MQHDNGYALCSPMFSPDNPALHGNHQLHVAQCGLSPRETVDKSPDLTRRTIPHRTERVTARLDLSGAVAEVSDTAPAPAPDER